MSYPCRHVIDANTLSGYYDVHVTQNPEAGDGYAVDDADVVEHSATGSRVAARSVHNYGCTMYILRRVADAGSYPYRHVFGTNTSQVGIMMFI